MTKVNDTDIPKLERAFPISAIQFQANKDFHKHNDAIDSAFLGYQRRSWMQRGHKSIDPRREREMLTTLLSTQEQEVPSDCVDKLIEDEIAYRDLAALTSKDLELLGFKTQKQRDELLALFVHLPNQDATYTQISEMPIAQMYNSQIVNNATSHLAAMRTSIASTNYKLQMMPPEDVVVGDKRYASCFALDALTSVKLLSDELLKDLEKLEECAEKVKNLNVGDDVGGASKTKHQSHGGKKSFDEKNEKSSALNIYWLSSIAFGFFIALWMWKSKKSA